jgi:hypothetical protein
MLESFGATQAQVQEWAKDDYETLYVFHITRTGKNGAPRATLDIQQEGLSGTLSDTCPGPS